MGRMTTSIIKRVYAKRYDLEYDPPVPRSQYYLSRLQPLVVAGQKRKMQIILLVSFVILIVATVHYYNLIVNDEEEALASIGRVNALLQRRNDISINLSKAALDYSKHERNVFTAVVALRSALTKPGIKSAEIDELLKGLSQPGKAVGAKPVTEPGKDPVSSLTGLLALGEQYPKLELSATFQSLIAALVEVEKDLAQERIKFNNTVKIYSAHLRLFPNNIFARIFGFKDLPYYQATEDAKGFRPIDY
ncbi:MAG: LemA family protein [Deltaproteobacteria bacterium]|nr:LemA family protein [Deltaproteobacteria bacterium]